VARRWDQLGGRLSAIVNARALAKLFDLEFRFVWPHGLDPAVNDPSELLSESFLDAYELPLSELERIDADQYMVVDEVFEPVRAPGESEQQARDRFRRCFHEIGWNDDARRMIGSCGGWGGSGAMAAMHVRAGDVIDGDWRDFLLHEKLTPTPFVHEAIRSLTEGGERRVLVFSDNDDYRTFLTRRFDGVVTAEEIIPAHERLSAIHRAFAEILALSRCELIVGPPNSAFSRLAANLGARELRRADTLIAPGCELEVLRAGIAEHRDVTPDSRPSDALRSRDICWCLDVFEDSLSLAEQHDLAREATGLDPDFAGALTRHARIATLTGDLRAARRSASRGSAVAESAGRSDDPLFEALVTEVVWRCFAVVQHHRGLTARSSRRTLERSVELVARCVHLDPIWIWKVRALEDLGFLTAVAAQVAAEPADVRKRVARSLETARHESLDLPRIRKPGLEHHRSVRTYDPLTRDLDRITLHLYRAVHQAGLTTEAPALAQEVTWGMTSCDERQSAIVGGDRPQ
jgi:hypothetical protein